MTKAHVWRYDSPEAPEVTPNPGANVDEWPWIASFEGAREPVDFRTWAEAYDFAYRVMHAEVEW